MIRIGLDVGSTTLKSVVLDESGAILYQQYERHYSQITLKVIEMLSGIQRMFPDQATIRLCISGSAGMGLAQDLGIPFAQEVYATREAVNALLPGTDVVIELGGEDAKILFLSGAMDVCMNGSCAGGNRRVHRPDGDAFGYFARRNERPGDKPQKDLQHRLALRRVRQIRYSALN